MPVKHLNIWKKYLPEAMYVNVYGPTEITCNCTYHIIDREYEPGENLPIGKPFPNEKVFLLDEEDREVTKPGEKREKSVYPVLLCHLDITITRNRRTEHLCKIH